MSILSLSSPRYCARRPEKLLQTTMASLTPRAACDAGQLLCPKTSFARCPSKLGRHSPRCSATASSSSVEMPGGVFWLDKMSHNNDVVYGENFVLQRPRRGGPGLVLSPKLQAMAVHQTGDKLSAPPAAIQSQPRLASMPIVFGAGLDFLDITDYIFLDDEVDSEDGGAFGPLREGLGSDCTGIVLHSSSPSLNPCASPQDEADDVVRPSAANPRRTRKVQFTCNLCGETTTKMVNPHAWEKGTVFAQCSGCNVKHKLIDNLKLFHELQGPVFSGPGIRPQDMPAGMPPKPLIDFHQHPGLFDMFNADD